jgi:hypothetical protein
MTKFKLFGAAALVLSTALAGPVLAKDAPRDHAQKQMRMTSHQMTPHRMHQRHMAYRNDTMVRRNDDMAYRSNNNGWNDNYAWNDGRRDSGFWPADVAAGVVGGAVATADAAVDTAGAIATAPFRGTSDDSYAYYNEGGNNGWNGFDNGWNRQTYAQRNGFVCQPGSWFKGEDGRPHLCQ